MLIQNKDIAIIGAGPGGLTLARLLQLRGAKVKVYERDKDTDARVQGSPLDMHEESGAAALQKADLSPAFHAAVRVGADKKIIVNNQAEIVFSDHSPNSGEEENSAPLRPEIDRGALRKILLDSLRPETVVWDRQFIAMEKQENGWLLHFKNGFTAYADVVIAADGANSKIRPYITGIKAIYSGVTMLEINIYDAEKTAPQIFKMLNGGKIMAFGNSKCILGGQKGNGDLGFYLSFKPDENWSKNNTPDYSGKANLLEWFKKEYPEWSSTWYELIEKATPPFIPRPIYCVPLNQTWDALPNATMLGDAAHVMPPFAGEGANTAMFDALELSELLTSDNFGSMPSAIAAYETNMLNRSAKAAKQSLENGERMHSEGALEKMLAVNSPEPDP